MPTVARRAGRALRRATVGAAVVRAVRGGGGAVRASEVKVEDESVVWVPHVSGRERARNRRQLGRGIIVFLSFSLTAPLVFFDGNGIEGIEN